MNARRADRLANTARQEAQRAKESALEARERQEWSARLQYDAEIYTAAMNYEAGRAGLARKQLAELIPKSDGEPDFRGFEWYYLDSLFNRELRVLKSDNSRVTSMAFSPDGRRLAATGYHDKTVHLWDSVSGKELVQMRGHEERVESVAFSPDGRRLASGSWDKTVRVWDAETGEELSRLSGGQDINPAPVRFSPDGRRIASSYQGAVAFWDAQSYQRVENFPHSETERIGSLAFGPDGNRIAISSEYTSFDEPEEIRVFDLVTRRELWSSRGQRLTVSDPATTNWAVSYHIAYSPDGRRVATPSGDNTVRVRDAETGREVLLLVGHTARVTDVVFSPDGKRIASADYDSSIRIWDSNSGKQLADLRGHGSAVLCLAYSPDGRRIASGGGDGSICLWDGEGDLDPSALRGGEMPGRAAVSPDGRIIACKNFPWGNEVRGIDAATGRVIAVSDKPVLGRDHVASFWLSNECLLVAKTREDGTAQIEDLMHHRGTVILGGQSGEIVGIAFSRDGRRVASASSDKIVRIWEVDSGRCLIKLQGHSDRINSIAFSPDGNRVCSGSDDGSTRVWDVDSGHVVAILRNNEGVVDSVMYSPSGDVIASMDYTRRRRIDLWDIAAARKIDSISYKGNGVIVFSPDGGLIALDDGYGLVLLDARSGRRRRAIDVGATNGFVDFAFSPDGQRIAMATFAGEVYLVDAVSGRELVDFQRLEGYESAYNSSRSVTFSPDGQMIVSKYAVGTMRVWGRQPLTPERRVQREALGLVRFHLRRVRSEAEFRDRINRDRTISEAVRAEAQKLAPGLWDEEAASRSARLNEESWSAVENPDRDQASYREALAKASEACHLLPNNANALNTLGIAQYRTGLFREALSTLARSTDLQKKLRPSGLAFFAMAQQELGDSRGLG